MNIILVIVAAFVLTALIECGLAMLFKSKRLVWAVFLCNLLTNPLLNLILLLYNNFIGRNHYWTLVIILEIIVVAGEVFLIKAMAEYEFKKAAVLSLLFNGCSFLAGFLLTHSVFLLLFGAE